MDNLIVSLPNQENGVFCVFNTDNPDDNEHNVCPTEQVNAANNKGWQCYHWYNDEWQLSSGSDPSAITTPQTHPSADASIYDLSGRKVGNAHQKGIVIRQENGNRMI